MRCHFMRHACTPLEQEAGATLLCASLTAPLPITAGTVTGHLQSTPLLAALLVRARGER
jgi:hypothetical protein